MGHGSDNVNNITQQAQSSLGTPQVVRTLLLPVQPQNLPGSFSSRSLFADLPMA